MNRFNLMGAGLFVISATFAIAQGITFRNHTETQAAPLRLLPAVISVVQNQVSITDTGDSIRITGNGLPTHTVGTFPNADNPNKISAQQVDLTVPAMPTKASAPSVLSFGWIFGVSTIGVVFDPLAAEFWAGNPRSGWSYNALGGAIGLGLDTNYAHVQPTGAYHYHGMPAGLMDIFGWRADAHSPLIGYAADGFPIYALTGASKGGVITHRSSYQLKSGTRPGGDDPTGPYDGTFNEDFEYRAGSGTLDACNGAMTVSADYPQGTYAYFLTQEYPVIPRCFAGTPDTSFRLMPNR